MSDPDQLAVMAEQRARDLLRAHRALDQAGIATMGKDDALTVPERVALLIDEVTDRRTDLAMALTHLHDVRLALADRDQEVERLRGLIAESCGCISI